MISRDKILENVRKNEPAADNDIPAIMWHPEPLAQGSIVETFIAVAHGIGTTVIQIKKLNDIKEHLRLKIENGLRVVNTVYGLTGVGEYLNIDHTNPHLLENVEIAILQAAFGVAENSALWVTEKEIALRVLPFICQHLIMILNAAEIVADTHQAYQRSSNDDYGFATFIAGPSKTADIEQSLVLGAHGPRSLTIFLLTDQDKTTK